MSHSLRFAAKRFPALGISDLFPCVGLARCMCARTRAAADGKRATRRIWKTKRDLRGYGNAIVPQVAAIFIDAAADIIQRTSLTRKTI